MSKSDPVKETLADIREDLGSAEVAIRKELLRLIGRYEPAGIELAIDKQFMGPHLIDINVSLRVVL